MTTLSGISKSTVSKLHGAMLLVTLQLVNAHDVALQHSCNSHAMHAIE